jgi:site-specific recombinase XerD
MTSDRNTILLRDLQRHLRSKNRSPRTYQSHEEAALLLAEFCEGRPLEELTPQDISAFISAQLDGHKPTTAAVRYRALRRLYRWMVDEEIIERSPHGKDAGATRTRAVRTEDR